MNKTLFKYIFEVQLKAMLFVSAFVFGLIFIFDFAEVMRRFPASSWQETLFVIKLSLLRTPITFCEVLGYVYFITATFSLWILCNSNQITIMKSAGKSPQQILYPFITFAFFIATLWLFVIHPLGQLSEEHYKRNIPTNTSRSMDTNENIWINYNKEEQVIFIKKISDICLDRVHIFDLGKNFRLFAKHGTIEDKKWTLKDITSVDKNGRITNMSETVLQNSTSKDLIELLSKSPQYHNIYQLRNVYNIQEENGVILRTYELELHKLFAMYISFILFALIAAIICFPISRYKSKVNISIKVIAFAILLRFTNNLLESLVHSGVLFPLLAAWGAVLTLLLIAVSILIWREM